MSDDTQSVTPSAPEGGPRRPMRFSGCAVCLSAAALLLGLVFCLGALFYPAYVRRQVFQGQPAWRVRQIQRYTNERLNFPREWSEIRPFAPKFRREFEALRAVWQTRDRRSDKLLQSIYESSSRTLLLASLRPQLEQLRRTVDCEGYDLEAFDHPSEWQFDGLPNAYQVVMLQLQDLIDCTRRESYDQALSNTLVLLRSLKRNPACSNRTHDDVNWATWQAMKELKTAAEETTQPAMLARVLSEMNRLDRVVNLNVRQEYPDLHGSLGELRAMKREGFPITITPGKPACAYAYQLEKAWREFPVWMQKRLSPGDPRQKQLETIYGGVVLYPWLSPVGLRQRFYLLKQRVSPEFFYVTHENVQSPLASSPSPSLDAFHEKRAKVYYDLTRLILAQRLVELSGETTSGSMEALVPKYLPKVPVCPFSGKPYLWDAAWNGGRGRFYSIGPDKLDDKGAPFNPSGGKGDLAVGCDTEAVFEYLEP